MKKKIALFSVAAFLLVKLNIWSFTGSFTNRFLAWTDTHSNNLGSGWTPDAYWLANLAGFAIIAVLIIGCIAGLYLAIYSLLFEGELVDENERPDLDAPVFQKK